MPQKRRDLETPVSDGTADAAAFARGSLFVEETTPCATPRDNEGLVAPRPATCHEQMTCQQPYVRIFRLSTWCASLSAQPLLRCGFGREASKTANEGTSLAMRGAAKRSKEQIKSKAASFLAGSALRSARSIGIAVADNGRSRAQPLRFSGDFKRGILFRKEYPPFGKPPRLRGK